MLNGLSIFHHKALLCLVQLQQGEIIKFQCCYQAWHNLIITWDISKVNSCRLSCMVFSYRCSCCSNWGWLWLLSVVHFVLQVLWWSWVSHPLSPLASSCSCWLERRSLRLEILPRTEPSSMERRNVGLITHSSCFFVELVTYLWSLEDIIYFEACTLTALCIWQLHQFCSSSSCNVADCKSFFSVLLQCLEWSSPLDRPLYMLWLACMETLQRWVLGYACSSSSRLIRNSHCCSLKTFAVSENRN